MLNSPQLTTLPAAIDALKAAFATIPSSPAYGTLQVHDGPALGAQVLNMIAVGVGTPSVSHSLRQDRPMSYQEAYDITCLTWAWSAERDMSQHRARCVTVLGAVRDAMDDLDLGSNATCRLGSCGRR